MSAPRCVLRFRSAGDAAPAGARAIVELFVNDAPAPAGRILWLDPEPGIPGRWVYVLADGCPTGLQSVLSRQDLEGLVTDHYVQELTGDRQRSA